MPELPEIEAHAERLATALVGQQLVALEPLSFTVLKTYDPPAQAASDHPLVDIGHRGKYLLLDFGDLTFVVHLMQGGRLRPDPKRAKKPRGGLARWTFADGQALLLTEAGTEKRAGVWVVAGDPQTQVPLDHLGPDADGVTVEDLSSTLAESSMRLHGFLRDQSRIAGLGRRLANEICHRARLSPFASTKKLEPGEVARLHRAMHECIAESLDFERSLKEMSSSTDRPAEVHHRTGEACPVCGDEIREVAYSKYTVHYCANCQTGGKVLADNTTSKFLK